MESEKKKNKKKGLLVLLLCLLLIGAASYGISRFFCQRPKETMTVISGDFLPKGKDAKKMSDKELAKFAQKKADASQFNLMIASIAQISHRTQAGLLPIRNPKTNVYAVNVVITDDRTGNIIYTSGAIQPGEEVSAIQLEKTLDRGTYQATARFSLYDAVSQTKKGEVAAGVKFIVD